MSAIEELRERIELRSELPPPSACRALRKSHGLSIGDIARTVGVSRQAIAFWETGERRPQGENLSRYAAVIRMLREVS
jgi:DNA-binding transcriptional regulator YiaG